MSYTVTIGELADIANDVYSATTELPHITADHVRFADDGYFARSYLVRGTHVMAYRGTQGASDVMQDLQIYTEGGSHWRSAIADAKYVMGHASGHVIFTGHSLGGWLAKRAQFGLKQERCKLPDLCVSFNGPNLKTGVITTWGSTNAGVKPASPRAGGAILNFMLKGDVVSEIGRPLGHKIVVPGVRYSDYNPLSRHSMTKMIEALAAAGYSQRIAVNFARSLKPPPSSWTYFGYWGISSQ